MNKVKCNFFFVCFLFHVEKEKTDIGMFHAKKNHNFTLTVIQYQMIALEYGMNTNETVLHSRHDII